MNNDSSSLLKASQIITYFIRIRIRTIVYYQRRARETNDHKKETKLKRKKTIKISSFMKTFIGKFMAHHTCNGIEVVQNRLKLLQPLAFTLIIGLNKISCK